MNLFLEGFSQAKAEVLWVVKKDQNVRLVDYLLDYTKSGSEQNVEVRQKDLSYVCCFGIFKENRRGLGTAVLIEIKLTLGKTVWFLPNQPASVIA